MTDRFARFQAQWLNVHVDFPLLPRIALPITIGSVRYRGIKLRETRGIRLLEVPLHAGSTLGGGAARQLHQAVLTSFRLSAHADGVQQLRYELRKVTGHGLLERDGTWYAYVGVFSFTVSQARIYAVRWTRSDGQSGPDRVDKVSRDRE